MDETRHRMLQRSRLLNAPVPFGPPKVVNAEPKERSKSIEATRVPTETPVDNGTEATGETAENEGTQVSHNDETAEEPKEQSAGEEPKEQSAGAMAETAEGIENSPEVQVPKHEEAVGEPKGDLPKEMERMRPHEEVRFRGSLAYTFQCRGAIGGSREQVEPADPGTKAPEDPPKTSNTTGVREETPKEPCAREDPPLPPAEDVADVPKDKPEKTGEEPVEPEFQRPFALDENESIAPHEQKKARKDKKANNEDEDGEDDSESEPGRKTSKQMQKAKEGAAKAKEEKPKRKANQVESEPKAKAKKAKEAQVGAEARSSFLPDEPPKAKEAKKPKRKQGEAKVECREEAKEEPEPGAKEEVAQPSPKTLAKKKRSRQCCAYRNAYTLAVKAGKEEEESREAARAVPSSHASID